MPTVDFSSQVVALLPVAVDGDADDDGAGVAGEKVVHEVVTEVAGDKGGGRRPFSVGVSRRVTSLEEMPEAYAQACRAVQVGRRVHGGASTTFFDQLGVHRLIALVPDAAELRVFTRDVLGPLAEDTTEARDLRETLRILLDTNFNVAEAARLQFFHYNTLRYRVGKLERLLGPLSSDPDLRLDVAVALRVLELHDVQATRSQAAPGHGDLCQPVRRCSGRSCRRRCVMGATSVRRLDRAAAGRALEGHPVRRRSVMSMFSWTGRRSGSRSAGRPPAAAAVGQDRRASAPSTSSPCSVRRSCSRSSWGSTPTSRSCSRASARSCSC